MSHGLARSAIAANCRNHPGVDRGTGRCVGGRRLGRLRRHSASAIGVRRALRRHAEHGLCGRAVGRPRWPGEDRRPLARDGLEGRLPRPQDPPRRHRRSAAPQQRRSWRRSGPVEGAQRPDRGRRHDGPNRDDARHGAGRRATAIDTAPGGGYWIGGKRKPTIVTAGEEVEVLAQDGTPVTTFAATDTTGIWNGLINDKPAPAGADLGAAASSR